MRPQRRRGVTTASTTAGHEREREEWIEIPVPALVTEESFARAQQLLQQNKIRSRRRTIAPSVVQGLVSCAKCGYAFSRTSTQTSARKIHYYKCIGSDSWRKLGGPVCDNGRFIRQELLDQIVWAEVIRLLEDPTLIQQELDRRLVAARAADPTRKREQSLQRELTHIGKGVERLLNAYQEGLLSIEQSRQRMPVLRQRQQALSAELQAIADHFSGQLVEARVEPAAAELGLAVDLANVSPRFCHYFRQRGRVAKGNSTAAAACQRGDDRKRVCSAGTEQCAGHGREGGSGARLVSRPRSEADADPYGTLMTPG